MKRKVVLHGPSTLTISLPASWVKKFNIKKGDELNLEEHEKDLRINFEKESEIGKKQINIGNLTKLGKRYMTASYRQGYDELHLSYFNSKFREDIQNIVGREIIGFEIVKQNNNFCIIKDLTGHSKDEFNSALRRIWLLTIGLSEESLRAIKENEYMAIKNIKLMDHSINKFTNYCLRLLTKKGHSDFRKTPLYYHLVKSLEEIADQYKDLCVSYLSNKEKVDNISISSFNKINKHLEEFYSLFYKYDEKKMDDLLKDTKLTHAKISDSKKKMGHYLSSICRDIRDLLSVVVEINL